MGLLSAGKDLRTIEQLLTTAESEARAHGDELPGPEHLLLSALALPDGSAARAFAAVGADPAALRGAVEQSHADALAAVGIHVDEPVVPPVPRPATGVFRSTPQAQQVFQEATALSRLSRPSSLLGAHVVAAACALERGTVVRALAGLGVDRGELRAAALREAGVPR